MSEPVRHNHMTRDIKPPGVCPGCDRYRHHDATTTDLNGTISALISEHAPHGFAGFMRGADQGCAVYVAAVALQNALLSTNGATDD